MKKIAYVCFLAALAGACVSRPPEQRVAGTYLERIASKDGSRWSLVLAEWGDFMVEHQFAKAKSDVDGGFQTGDQGYRGKWAVVGRDLTLKRDDGAIEHLEIRESFWGIQLMPARADQSLFDWNGKLVIK